MNGQIDIPPEFFPDGVGPGSFDPETLQLAAEAHCRHPFNHTMEVKAWVIRYLLSAFAHESALLARVEKSEQERDEAVLLLAREMWAREDDSWDGDYEPWDNDELLTSTYEQYEAAARSALDAEATGE